MFICFVLIWNNRIIERSRVRVGVRVFIIEGWAGEGGFFVFSSVVLNEFVELRFF